MIKKLIGLILIAIGALPFLLKLESIAEFFSQNIFLVSLRPGNIVYQLVIIILGILLVWKRAPRPVH